MLALSRDRSENRSRPPLKTERIVGFLDDLRRQAEAQTAEREQAATSGQRNAMLADAACKTTFQYWMQLATQLNVLQPVAKTCYVIDSRHKVEGLPLSGFRVDARHQSEATAAPYDHVVLQCAVRSGQHLTITKNFLTDIERLEGRLRQACIQPEVEAVRNPDNGKLQEMRYDFDADISISVLLTPDHSNASVRFEVKNIDGLETVSFDLRAIEVSTARLDELAKWLVGQPHEFLKGAQNLRRTEAP